MEVTKDINDGYLDEVRLNFDSPSAAPYTVPWRVQIYNTSTPATSNMVHHGAYMNDQITLSRKITLSAGIRWDVSRITPHRTSVRVDTVTSSTPVARSPTDIPFRPAFRPLASLSRRS